MKVHSWANMVRIAQACHKGGGASDCGARGGGGDPALQNTQNGGAQGKQREGQKGDSMTRVLLFCFDGESLFRGQ